MSTNHNVAIPHPPEVTKTATSVIVTSDDPKIASAQVQRQLDEANDRIRNLVAEHRLLRHKKYREETILCLHKNPAERTDAQQQRIDNLVAANQTRSYAVAHSCNNIASVMSKNLRKAVYSKEGASGAENTSRPVKSSLSKVIDDNLNNHANRQGNCLVASNCARGGGIEAVMVTGDGSNHKARRPNSASSTSSRNNASKYCGTGSAKLPARLTGGYRSDADDGAFWMQHDWRQVEKEVLSGRSTDRNRIVSRSKHGKVFTTNSQETSQNLGSSSNNNKSVKFSGVEDKINKEAKQHENVLLPLDPRKVRLRRKVPDIKDSGIEVDFDRSKNMIPPTIASKNAALELIKRHQSMLQQIEAENNDSTRSGKKTALSLVHDELRNMNLIGSSKRRGPPPSQLASSTILRQYNEKTKRRDSEIESLLLLQNQQQEGGNEANNNNAAKHVEAKGNRLALLCVDDVDGNNLFNNKNRAHQDQLNSEHNRTRKLMMMMMTSTRLANEKAKISSSARGQQQHNGDVDDDDDDDAENQATCPAASTQVIIDRAKPGPPRRYVRSGAYLIADRRRNQWKEADQFFVDSSPVRTVPKHKMVAEKGFGLLEKKTAIDEDLAMMVRSSRRSEISDLTESTTRGKK